MNRKIILFGAFLSAFILILVPSINCVNANIQNENNLNTMNINIDEIKKIKNRILNNDCNCQKTTDYNNSGNPGHDYICYALLILIFITLLPFIFITGFEKLEDIYEKLWGIAMSPIFMLARHLDCYWINGE